MDEVLQIQELSQVRPCATPVCAKAVEVSKADPASVYLQSTDREKYPSQQALGTFLREVTTLRRLRDCGRYGTARRCDLLLCTRCGPRSQRRDARKARSVIGGAGSVILWTATVEDGASGSLADSWNSLARAWESFSAKGWLRQQVDGYVRHTGITVSDRGWHPHFHTLLIFRNELLPDQVLSLRTEIPSRWVRRSSRLGTVAVDLAQDLRAPVAGRHAGGLIAYAVRQTWGHPHGVRGTPEGLLVAAARGDADALDLWHELERASHGRRFRAAAGVFRAESPGNRA